MFILAGILVLGILAQWYAWRIHTPAILPLIIIGLLVGPFSEFVFGTKIIDSDAIFQESLLFDFVSLSVGVILFEGGLTLKASEIKHLGKAVRNIILFGSLITFIGGAAAGMYWLGMEWRIALLFGSLVIVTGPTVIRPILNNVKPNHNVSTVLKWEGVLIDPLGAFVAILIYEFIVSGHGGKHMTLNALHGFFLIILSGVACGTGMALLIHQLIKRKLIPHYLMNSVILALVVGTFALSDFLYAESGLLAVTLLGMILSNTDVEEIKDILSFKEDITVILISILFICLSARINVEDIKLLGWESLIVFFALIFIIRPLGVFIGTLKSNLNIREKLFISWIGPRGIVAAGVASIFTLRLSQGGGGLSTAEVNDAQLLLPMTFLIILGTVILQGGSAKWVAKKLKVLREQPNGLLFIGADEASRAIALFLLRKGIPVMVSDTSKSHIREAMVEGIPYYSGSLLVDGEYENADLSKYGQVLALTSSTEINVLACKTLAEEFGKNNVYRLISRKEQEVKELTRPTHTLFKGEADFIMLTQVVRNEPEFEVKAFENVQAYERFLHLNANKIIPLFIQLSEDRFVPVSDQKVNLTESFRLVYIEKIE